MGTIIHFLALSSFTSWMFCSLHSCCSSQIQRLPKKPLYCLLSDVFFLTGWQCELCSLWISLIISMYFTQDLRIIILCFMQYISVPTGMSQQYKVTTEKHIHFSTAPPTASEPLLPQSSNSFRTSTSTSWKSFIFHSRILGWSVRLVVSSTSTSFVCMHQYFDDSVWLLVAPYHLCIFPWSQGKLQSEQVILHKLVSIRRRNVHYLNMHRICNQSSAFNWR